MMTVGILATVTVAYVLDHVRRPVQVDFLSSAAWLVSWDPAAAVLVDGEAAEVAARVDLTEWTRPSTAQTGQTAFVFDDVRGLARIDPATHEVGFLSNEIDDAPRHLMARSRPDGMYLIDQEEGFVASVDLRDIDDVATGQALPEPIESSAVDRGGRLWALGRSGELATFDGWSGAARHPLPRRARGGALVVADDDVIVIDAARAKTYRLDADGSVAREGCLADVDEVASAQFTGAHTSLTVYGVWSSGALTTTDLGSPTCDAPAIGVSSPGDDLGTPLELDGHVFVANRTTGRAVVVDVATGAVHHSEALAPAGSPLEFVEQGGVVFYNDPASEHAGILHVDGTHVPINKLTPTPPSPQMGDGAGSALGAQAGDAEAEGRDDTAGPEPSDRSAELDRSGPAPAGTQDIGGVGDLGPSDGGEMVVPGASGDPPSGPLDPGPGSADPGDGDNGGSDSGPPGTGGPDDPSTGTPGPVTLTGLRITTPMPDLPGSSLRPEFDSGYMIGQQVEVMADVNGTFRRCEWVIEEVRSPCAPVSSDQPNTTVGGVITLPSWGEHEIELDVDGTTMSTTAFAHDVTSPTVNLDAGSGVLTSSGTLQLSWAVSGRDDESGLELLDVTVGARYRCSPDGSYVSAGSIDYEGEGQPQSGIDLFTIPACPDGPATDVVGLVRASAWNNEPLKGRLRCHAFGCGYDRGSITDGWEVVPTFG